MGLAQAQRMLTKQGQQFTVRTWSVTGGYDKWRDPIYDAPTTSTIYGMEHVRSSSFVRSATGEDVQVDAEITVASDAAPAVVEGLRRPEIVNPDGFEYLVERVDTVEIGMRTLYCRRLRP